MLLGGRVGQMEIAFGEKATKVPAKAAAEAVVRVVGRFAGERSAGETFTDWLDRSGGAKTVGEGLRDLDEFPTPEDGPDFYVDFHEQTDGARPHEIHLPGGDCTTEIFQ